MSRCTRAAHEDDDGQPLYGQRLSPEELAEYLAEQGIENPAGPSPEPVRGADDAPDAIGPRPVPTAGTAPYARPFPVAAPRARATSPAWPRRTTLIGLFLLLIVPAALFSVTLLTGFETSHSRAAALGEGGVVYLDRGTRSALYSSVFGATTTDCTVASQDGGAVDVTPMDEALPYGVFEAPETGTYTVTCPDGTRDVIVGTPLNLSRLPLISLLAVASVFSALVGLVATTIGVVGIARHRRRPMGPPLGPSPR